MPVDKYGVIYCLISVGYVLQSTGVSGVITTAPSNTAVVSGSSATLHCNSNVSSTSIYWNSPTINNLVFACATTQPGYSVISTATGQCDLVITSANPSFVGAYQCFDLTAFGALYSAYLTVLTSNPNMTSNPTPTNGYVAKNDVVNMSCSVGYTAVGGMEAYMTWNGSDCTPSTSSNSTTYATSSVTVVAEPPTLSSCNCTTQITAPTSPPGAGATGNIPALNAPSYSSSITSASGIIVSYCPVNTTISPAGGNVSQYTTFTCYADAVPSDEVYHWTLWIGNGTVSGQTFQLESVGDYNISCYATNDLYGGTSNPCTSNTTSVNGSSYVSTMPTRITTIPPAERTTSSSSTDGPPPSSGCDSTCMGLAIGLSIGGAVLIGAGIAGGVAYNNAQKAKKEKANSESRERSQSGDRMPMTTDPEHSQNDRPKTNNTTQPSSPNVNQNQGSSLPYTSYDNQVTDPNQVLYAELKSPSSPVVINEAGSRNPIQYKEPEHIYGFPTKA